MKSLTRDLKINIAEFWPETNALGPGLRSVVWVQGCVRNCPGCVSPEWIPRKKATVMKVEDLAGLILSDSKIDGVTFSGGEPMLQAAGLAELVSILKKCRSLNVICYTGYTYEQLLIKPTTSPVHDLLNVIDVLIDGPYVKSLDDNLGLRGSSNQRILFLTDQLKGYDFETLPRQAEIHVNAGYAMMIGVPPLGVLQKLDQTIENRGIRKI